MGQVDTREGIFSAGGYGGGVFDGAQMGFGGVGSLGSDAAWAIAGLTSPTQWTIGQNEWPSTVSQAVVKSGTRWKELPAANPGMKLVTINGQANLSPWKVGQVVNLPASWVSGGAVAPAPSPSASNAGVPIVLGKYDDRVLELQFALNTSLEARKAALVPEDGIMTAKVCAAIKAVVADVKAGHYDITVDGGLDKVLKEVGGLVTNICQATPAAPPPVVAPIVPVTPPAGVVCDFEYGDKHPQITALQKELNLALDKAGYVAIPVSGVYDAATCGGIFALGGSFKPTPSAQCGRGWVVPLDCPSKTPPKKKDDGSSSKISMAWMLGGIATAAAVAGLYAMKKR